MSGRDLVERTRALLPGAPEIGYAFVATRGLRPGGEVVGMPLALVTVVLLPGGSLLASALIGAVAGGAIALVLGWRRRFFTIAFTTDSAYVIKNDRVRRADPRTLELTVTRADPVVFRDGGDPSVEVAGTRYWVSGSDADEARRAATSWR